MFKKVLVFVFFISLLFSFGSNVEAQNINESEVNIYFFWGEGCPHCEKEKIFLEKLEEKYSQINIYDFDITQSVRGRQIMSEMGEKLNTHISGVPFTVIGEQYFIGWYDEQSTGMAIEGAVQDVLKNKRRDIGQEILSLIDEVEEENSQNEEIKSPIPEKLKVPLFGEIKTKNLSLPVFTIVLGALDGFNPCAMWVLLFLISLLLGMKDKKRMWILGSTFIVASALVYFIFMAAWLNFILFIGLVVWVRIIIGLVALFGGSYSLKEYFTNKEATCQVVGTEKKQKVFQRLKNITQQKSFYLALGGIIILAFAVNLVELICSAGLPAVYTQVLALSDLTMGQYYAYLLLYILVFMLDDLLVFFVAMITLRLTGVTTKYVRTARLIGGVLMLIIGLLLIFKPGWLMFG
jgi:thiol-disulfide isomerase/thioredoxin